MVAETDKPFDIGAAEAFLRACEAEARQLPYVAEYQTLLGILRVEQDAAFRDKRRTVDTGLIRSLEFLYAWGDCLLTRDEAVGVIQGIEPPQHVMTDDLFARIKRNHG